MPEITLQEATAGYSVTIDGSQIGMVADLSIMSELYEPTRSIVLDAMENGAAEIMSLNWDMAELAMEQARVRRDTIRESATIVTIPIASVGKDVTFTFDDKEERDMFKQVMDTMLRNELPLAWHPGGIEVVMTPDEYDLMCLKMVTQGQAIHVAYLSDRELIASHDFDSGPFDFPNLTALGV